MTDPQTLRNWDNEHVWHPFAPMSAFRTEEVPIIERADGFDLIDAEGRRYLDGISSLWCNVHGHGVPKIDAAVKEQIDRMSHSTLLGLSNTPSIELAKRLVDLAPASLSKVFYSDSGSTAVEAALKIAYQYHRQKSNPEPQRDLFVCLSDAYHGDTVGSVSVGGMPLFHGIYRNMLFETLRIPAPVALHHPPELSKEAYLAWCFQEAEDVINEHADRIAGVVMEPLVQGAAGIWVHPPGYLKHLRNLTEKHGIPLIADEVAVGFGRTGTMFACEQEDVFPDLLCVAKGLSGGYLPLAATLATDEIYDAFLGEPSEGRTFFHGHTFTGNPLGCAAALANLQLFEESNLLKRIAENTERLKSRLGVLADHPHVAEVRQKGIMVGIELVANRPMLTPFPKELRMGHQVTVAARERGVIVRPLGDVIVLMPAPAMPVELIDRLVDVTIEAIDTAISQVQLSQTEGA
ncbi:adenosylmethionine--8-amino-7-oxononanoate transaminase [Thalassoroseus pseudoceratinae]|uniref:adenosylmethionine--8-amino-7-oxononanoate transaminase n=1 Tax=Thalassoroseus pseudoceratinae TaxID=2713176 RepID=UPI00142095B2|nr:adenosylmethionine--8-amino-7-oxononanoate transaminase [Thalassoroseus pseudoceratinae]